MAQRKIMMGAQARIPGTARSDLSRRTFCAGAGVLMAASALPVRAQSGNKPIKIVVPYEPGGSVDQIARYIGPALSARTGRPVYVENRGGAGASIGTEYVARSAPDGSTLLIHTGTIAVEYAAHKKVPYDLYKDFKPVSMIAAGPFALDVAPSVPVKNIQELIALAKAKPGALNYSSAGVGTSVQLAMELFKAMAGVDIRHVPYKGATPALMALMSGEVQTTIDPLITSRKLSEAKKVRTLAITTAQRSALWPEIPTIAESGVPGYNTSVWYGISVPSATSSEVVNALAHDLQAIGAAPGFKKWLNDSGVDPVCDSPEDFQHRLQSEVEIWSKLIKQANLKLY